MLSKKAKKLLRNPKLFFFDYLKHRLSDDEIKKSLKRSNLQFSVANINGISNDTSTKQSLLKRSGQKPKKDNLIKLPVINSQESLVVDRITDISYLINEIFSYLLQHTCFVQIVNTGNDHVFRIAVKSNDLDYVLNVMKGFTVNDYFIEEVITREASNNSLMRSFCFRKYNTIFKSLIIEIDPWHLSEKYSRIYTHNYNPFCTHINHKYMNKTVFASHPYFLQGRINDINDYALTSLIKIPPSIYDNFDFDVDVVFTWVDGQDPEWLEKKEKFSAKLYSGNRDNYSAARYEQIDELKYAMRSIAAYFKSFRKIYIVTDKQIPWWLDISHPKVEIVDHMEIFPNVDILPVFNSHAIEANLHRIKGLSKKFIYMNDDVFIWKPINKSKFYASNGISISRFENISNVHGEVDITQPAWSSAALNGNDLLENKFGMKSYSYHLHCPHALDRDVIYKMWNDFPNEHLNISTSKFRSHKDISPLSFFYHAYSFINSFSIKEAPSLCKSYTLNSANNEHIKTLETIAKDDYSVDFVCLNDGGENRLTDRVLNALSTKFPVKADWEY
jgi:hypothetical protein